MIKIVLCEDDSSQLQMLGKTIHSIEARSKGEFRLAISTTSPRDVIAYSKSQKGQHLFIIDIHLGDPDLDGLKLAKILRMQNKENEIILLTSDDDKMSVAFQNHLKVVDYILKGSPIEIEHRLWKNLTLMSEDKTKLSFYCKRRGEEYQFDLSDILFICTTSISGKLEIATIFGHHTLYNSLQEFEASYPELTRVSQGYLVNMENILRFDETMRKLVMIDGQQCDVSFRNRRRVRDISHNMNKKERLR